jgi:hypothetical protein
MLQRAVIRASTAIAAADGQPRLPAFNAQEHQALQPIWDIAAATRICIGEGYRRYETVNHTPCAVAHPGARLPRSSGLAHQPH